ncbi:MAG: CoA-binding protein, partial [Proteobacteria bacterium]
MNTSAGIHPLDGFFNAKSIAIIGASADPDKLGGKPIRYFRDAGYEGQIYPVNSKSAEIQGYRAYVDVTDIPGPVDQAMIILPAKMCMSALQACARKGIRFVQVLSSGFGEMGTEGKRAQDELLAFAQAHGIRLLGPNCLGLVSVRNRFYATFSTALETLKPTPGGVAVATQSGAFGSCAYAMAIQRGLGLSRIVATGNEADVDVAECIDFLVDDEETQVICVAIEGCGDADYL